MIQFNDEKEFLTEVACEKPALVRVTTLRIRDMQLPMQFHFFIIAGFRNSAGEIVELKCFFNSTLGDGEHTNKTIKNLNHSVEVLQHAVREVVPAAAIRSGRYLEGNADGTK